MSTEPEVPALPGVTGPLAALLHFAAEAHRRKWAFAEYDSAAFSVLHCIGNEMRAACEEVRAAETDAGAPVAASPAAVPDRRSTAATDADAGPWTESPGVALIAVERSRQVTAGGYTPEHDAEHVRGELALAAVAYALAGTGRIPQGAVWWPFSEAGYRPVPDTVGNLVKAGGLIAAELDRLIAKEKRRG